MRTRRSYVPIAQPIPIVDPPAAPREEDDALLIHLGA
jgi:hypothetical protein